MSVAAQGRQGNPPGPGHSWPDRDPAGGPSSPSSDFSSDFPSPSSPLSCSSPFPSPSSPLSSPSSCPSPVPPSTAVLPPLLDHHSLRIGALNVRGPHTPSALSKLVAAARFAARELIDILSLAEIGMDIRIHRSSAFQIKLETEFVLIVPPPDPRIAGVAHHSGTCLLVSPSWAKHQGQVITKGERLLAVPFHFSHHTVVFITMYQYTDPHSTNKVAASALCHLLEGLLAELPEMFHDPRIILMGDLNEVMDSEMDRTPRASGVPRPVANPYFSRIAAAFGLVDVFRALYPEARSFTFNGPSSQSRIDYIWSSAAVFHSITSCSHTEVPELYSDHALVWADMLVGPLLPATCQALEGFNPTTLALRKGVTEVQWEAYTKAVDELLPLTSFAEDAPEAVELMWEALSSAILKAGSMHVARLAPAHRKKKGRIHPVKIFPHEAEATHLHSFLKLHGPSPTHPDPEALWYSLVGGVYEEWARSGWPSSYWLLENDVWLTWWEWASSRVMHLNRRVSRLRKKTRAQRIRAAIEARCMGMKLAPSRALMSILDRYTEPISANVIVKQTPDGPTHLTAWGDVDGELQSIFHQWTAKRHPHTDNLLSCPRLAALYAPCDPALSALGSAGSVILEIELNTTLAACPGGKAPGPSGVSYEFLVHLGPKARALLLTLFNCCLRFSVVPQGWLEHTIIPIPKGKSTGDFNQTRPISLLDPARKLLEQIINRRIRLGLLAHPDTLTGGNFGFVPGDGIEGALAIVRETLADANESNSSLYMAQQDIRRAYDTVSWESLSLSLARVGMGPIITSLLGHMWQGRSARVKTNRAQAFFPSRTGLGFCPPYCGLYSMTLSLLQCG